MRPASRVSRYYFVGRFGCAQYQCSGLLQNAHRKPRHDRQHTYGCDVCGGIDFRIVKQLSICGEVTCLMTPSPRYNTPLTGQQHTAQASVGIVFFYQISFNPNCICRGSFDWLVTRPKLAPPVTLVFGLPKRTRFIALKASARNCNFNFSRI